MSDSNEELTVTNEELAITQQQLELSLASLTESEERFRTMAEGSGIFIAVSDETSNATYFNKEWMELTGRSMKDLLQFGWVDLVYPEDKERYVNIYLEAFKNKEPFTGEFRVLNKKGGYRWLLATGTARLLPDGSFAGYISSCIDITDRKKEEEEKRLLLNSIRDSETKLDQLINLLPASITVLIGEDFVIERTNPSNLAYWQRSGADVIGKPLLVALPELVDQAFPGQLKHVLDTGETIFEEEHPVKLESPDGSFNITYVDYSYQPLTNKDGKRIGVLVMSNDVTDKVESRWLLKKYAAELQGINKEAVTSNEELGAVNEELLATNEELSVMQRTLEGSVRELADSEARFRTMVQQAPVAISIQRGPHHFIESANDMMLAIVGKKTEEFVGKTYRKALPEISSQAFLGLLDKVYNTGETFYGYEVKAILKRDGQPVEGYYNFIYQAIIDENGASTGIMIVAIDVTGQVKARHQLQQAEEMLRMAVEAARIGSWYIEPETKALKYNTMLAKVFGYEGKTPMTYEQAIAQVGEEFRPRLLKQIESAIATGENYDMTYTHKRFNDGEIIWLRSLGKISPDDQGNYTIFSGVVMDVTEQKADEQRKNDFIGMVSHELKTPLTSLTAIVQVSNAKLKDNPDPFLSTSMEKATIQVKKMSNMINGFLNVSRLESGKMLVVKENFSLNELIEEIIKEHEITVTTHIIELNLCDHIQINADRDKIASVIANLISNAVKYSPKGKDIKVECRIINGHIQVSVKDEGMGIRAQDIQHVFDRYFRIATSHTQHISGFGIGLYLSAEIVSQHGGKIWAESESGVGSTFYFSLPLA
jgi:two-component system sensor histidine kinase VicK